MSDVDWTTPEGRAELLRLRIAAGAGEPLVRLGDSTRTKYQRACWDAAPALARRVAELEAILAEHDAKLLGD